MDIPEMRDLVESMYSDFDWYSGKFSKADAKWFRMYLRMLNEAAEND